MHSTPGVRSDLFPRSLSEVRLTDFFGGVSQVELSEAVRHPSGEAAFEGQDDVEPVREVVRGRRSVVRGKKDPKGIHVGTVGVVVGVLVGLQVVAGLVRRRGKQ